MESGPVSRECVVCGAVVPGTFRFCGACGRRLPEPETVLARETRRNVTVVFCDLVDSTSLGERVDPEVAREIVGRYFAATRAALISEGGTVEKFIGDAVMAVFGLTVLHEDDAARAVRASMATQAALTALNIEFLDAYGVTLTARIGVQTGEVVAGSAADEQRFVTGDTVNVASRLERIAPPGAIVIGEATRVLVRDVVETESLGEVPIRGRSAAVLAHSVVGLRSGTPSTLTRAPFVGRGDELAELTELWSSVADTAKPTIALVVAAPGSGKSRLLDELCVLAVDGRVMRATASTEVGASTIYRDLVASEHDGESRDEYDELLTAVLDGRAENYPLEETIAALVDHVERATTRSPVLVALEDLHWADASVLDLVAQLAHVSGPLLVVGTARPEGWDRVQDSVMAYTETHRLDLEQLAPEDSAALVRGFLGGDDVEPALLDRLAILTEGNPLFIEQTLRNLVEDGTVARHNSVWRSAVDLGSLPVASSAQAAVAARIDGLEPEHRTVLEIASVIGQVVEPDAVRALTTGGVDVGTAVTTLVRGGFLVRIGEAGALRFWHALVQAAAYERMLKRDRAVLHERHAAWLDEQPGVRVSTDPVESGELIGSHLARAYRLWVDVAPLAERTAAVGLDAGARLLAAGRGALLRGETRRAGEVLGRAVELVPGDDDRRTQALVDLGSALRESGQVPAATAVLTEALERAETSGDVGELWAVRWELADMPQGGANPQDWDDDEALAQARAIIPVLEQLGDELGLAKAWRLIALTSMHQGRLREADEASYRGGEHARRIGDRRQHAEIMALVPWLLVDGETPAPAALEVVDGLLAELAWNSRSWAFAASARAELLGQLLRCEEARAQLEATAAALSRSGITRWGSNMATTAASIEAADGHLHLAAEILAEFCATQADDAPVATSWIDALRVHYLLDAGADTGVEQVLRYSENDVFVGGIGYLWTAQARVLARQGELARALELADAAVGRSRGPEQLTINAEVLRRRADVRNLAGDLDGALADARLALELHERKADLGRIRQVRTQLDQITAD